MTRDNHYLCACDLGLDHVKIYRFDVNTGKIKLAFENNGINIPFPQLTVHMDK